MDRAARILLITRCAEGLAGRGWRDIDFLLEQFGLPTTALWADRSENSEFNYVREMLASPDSDDEDLRALDDYLNGPGTHDRKDEPWRDGSSFRVFISHLAEHKASANSLQSSLEWWGLDAFIAHKDINPGLEWAHVILAALHSCDALVGLLHTGFNASPWCDQEVGFAMGRSIPVVPVRIEIDPYGFFGMIQAVPWSAGDEPEADAAKTIVGTLMKDKRTSERVTDAIVLMLEHATSYANANALATALLEGDAKVSPTHLGRLRRAQLENSQVEGAWRVDAALTALEKRVGDKWDQAAQPPPSTEEEDYDPF